MRVDADRYWLMVSAINQTIAILEEREGVRVGAELANIDATTPTFVRFRCIDGEAMAVNPLFVGYLKLTTPEGRQFNEEWVAAHSKKEWEK